MSTGVMARQSTAVTLDVGPILDSTGAEYASAVIGDLTISKNGTRAAMAGNTFNYAANGMYSLTLTAGNTDTLGVIQISCNKATYQMRVVERQVVPQPVYDAIVLGTDYLQTDTVQFGGTNGTFSSGIPTAALDSAITAQITGIKTKTDNLPSDPADQSLIIDATNAVMARLGAPTGASISADIAGISVGAGGGDWTADERAAIRSILGIPGSGTTPANPTTGILDTIRDSVGTYIAGISAVASTTTGTIVGFPSSLNIGDSYTEEANSDIHVFIRDENDDPITAIGDFNFTDPEFAPEVNITQSGSTGRVKAVVTFVDTSPEDYLKVEIPSSQSRRASPGTATIQCLLKWVDTDGKVLCQKTLSKQAVTWNEMV